MAKQDTTGIESLRAQMERDGVIVVRDLLSGPALAEAQAAFDWTRDNPGPGRSTFPGDPDTWQDICNPAAYDAYLPMLQSSPIPSLLSRLWGGSPVWFMYEQIFSKQKGAGFTPWHQDTPYLPVAGEHLAVVWISLDPVSRADTLEYCMASHRGPLFNAASFKPGDPTDPLYKTGNMPRLPDVEADRSAWNIAGWATETGDVVIFHPSVLHGGGTPGPGTQRRTLTLRFFGEDVTYDRRPAMPSAPRVEGLHEMLGQGDPFRHPAFPKLA